MVSLLYHAYFIFTIPNPLFFSAFWYAIMSKTVADSGGQKMNRNNGVAIAKRLFALRDFFYTHADPKHAVKFAEIRAFYYNNRFKDGTNNKMIYADLHALKNLGIKVRYDEKSKGWFLDNPLFDANEIRLIADSVQASKFITQKKASSLTKRITENFGCGRRQNLNRQAYVYDRI